MVSNDVHDQFPVEELNVDFFDPCGGSVFGGTQENVGDGSVTGSAEGAGGAAKKKEEAVSSSSGGGVYSFGGGSLDEVPAVHSDGISKVVVPVSRESGVPLHKASGKRKMVGSSSPVVTSRGWVMIHPLLENRLLNEIRIVSREKGQSVSGYISSVLVRYFDSDDVVSDAKDNLRRNVKNYLERYGK